MEINKIYCVDALEGLKQLNDNFVDVIITSPPYWGLRDYGREAIKIWDENNDCEHDWRVERTPRPNSSGGRTKWAKDKLSIKGKENYSEFTDYNDRATYSDFCQKCGAWRGQLGLEPSVNLFIEHLMQITFELRRVLKPSGVMFWNMGNKYQKKCLTMQNERLILSLIDKQDWILRNRIIWHKLNAMPTSAKDRFKNSYEPVYMLTKNKQYYFDLDVIKESFKNKNLEDVWSMPTQSFPEAHFATFPEDLIRPMIKSGCPKDGIVLDPFMGVGTVGLVAKELDRDYIGFEIVSKYVEIAKPRIENLGSR